jgi:hypothetical protein
MKTTRTLKLITLTAAIFGFAATSFAQDPSETATASASAGARIIATPITIEKDIDLYFGDIVKTSSVNVVTLTPALLTSRTATVASSLLDNQTGTPTAAKFSVTGENSYIYLISLPNTAVDLTGPGTTMTVTNFSTDLADNKGTIGTNNEFYVGAKLNVNADQAVGTYTGTFDVTVTYE